MDILFLAVICAVPAADPGPGCRLCGARAQEMTWAYLLSGAVAVGAARVPGRRPDPRRGSVMSGQAWFTLLTYSSRSRRARRAPRELHGAHRECGADRRSHRQIRARHLSRGRRRSRAGHALDALCRGGAVVQFGGCAGRLSRAALAAVAAVESAALAERHIGLGLQYGRELRDQHQLAGLFRRVRVELFHSNGRARRAEFLLGGNGHRGCLRADPRLCTPLGARHRQLLGRPHAQHRSTSCCPCRSSWPSFSWGRA